MRMQRVLENILKRLQSSRRAAKGRRGERGMTLLEIMVVLIIIAMVGGFVGVKVLNMREEANRKAAKIQIGRFAEALEFYKLTFRSYPSTAEGLQALVTPKNNVKPFMDRVPKDPWENDYVYIYPGSNNQGGFDIMSYGADGVQGGGDDITSWDSGTESQKQ